MRLFILAFLVGISSPVFTQSKSIERTQHFNLEKGLALQGYDPVEYFTEGKAIKGNSERAFTYLGVTYYFSSDSNKKTFEVNPSQYEPQYGGWCAFAMGDYGKKVEIDPRTFKIVDGKLYLFYNAFFNNTLKSWNKDEINLKIKADKNWSTLIK